MGKSIKVWNPNSTSLPAYRGSLIQVSFSNANNLQVPGASAKFGKGPVVTQSPGWPAHRGSEIPVLDPSRSIKITGQRTGKVKTWKCLVQENGLLVNLLSWSYEKQSLQNRAVEFQTLLKCLGRILWWCTFAERDPAVSRISAQRSPAWSPAAAD